jgi:hypothetical protein
MPGALDALQRMGSTIVHRDSRANDEVAHRSRNKDLTRPSRSHHPGSKAHSDPADVTVPQLDLASMQPSPDL